MQFRFPSSIVLIISLLFTTSLLAAEHEPSPRDDPQIQKVEAFQVFDNLYYVGAKWVSCWVLETSEGLILIDTLYGGLVDNAVQGIKDLGLDPEDIRYVFVTHAHYDHIGGARFFQEKYGATLAMVQEDWDLAAGEPIYQDYPKPGNGLTITDGSTLTLGDTRVTFYKTPGHTTGVMSMKFRVFDDYVPYNAFMFGGVGLNFSGVERTETYINSVKRIMAMEDIDVNIPNHEGSGKVFERYEQLQSRKEGEPHSFVDAKGFDSWLNELLVNAEEKLVEEKAAAQ